MHALYFQRPRRAGRQRRCQPRTGNATAAAADRTHARACAMVAPRMAPGASLEQGRPVVARAACGRVACYIEGGTVEGVPVPPAGGPCRRTTVAVFVRNSRQLPASRAPRSRPSHRPAVAAAAATRRAEYHEAGI
eukprot:351281-Chlamydomonas_euryale.AAC.11